jgi:thioredoxin-like negative regulator of GroEL
MNLKADSASHWWVICLCAEWCNVCRDWRSAFEDTAKAFPELRFAWVDVEDEADAMGDVDIETFPTVLIAHDRRPLFLGPVQPSAAQLSRMIASLREHGDTDQPSPTASDEAAALLARLLDCVLPKP